MTDRVRKGWPDRWPALLLLVMLSAMYFWFTRFKAPKHLDVAGLNLTLPNGQPLPAGLLQGKAVILNFWAPWCGPCNVETPWLQAIQDRHAADLVVVGVDDDPETYGEIAEFAVRNNVRYPLVLRNGSVRSAVGTLAAVPTTLYIDRSGHVVHTITGAVPEPLMESFARDALR